MDLVSIIIPVYNVENYINRCVRSVINQTYRNIEIILIDDGSPDNSGEICDEFANKDNRILVIHKQNGGLSDARNHGIRKASGKYITFIDSDDWVSFKYIETLVYNIENYNAEISICGYISTANENYIFEEDKKIGNITVLNSKQAIEKQYDKDKVNYIVSWGKLYNINLFDNIEFPYGKIHEDEFTTYRLYSMANRIVATASKYYAYYQRNDSIMGSGFNVKARLDLIEALDQKASFLQSINQIKLYNKNIKLMFMLCLSANLYIKDMNQKQLFASYLKYCINIMKKSKNNNFLRIFGIGYELCPTLFNFAYTKYIILKKWISIEKE